MRRFNKYGMPMLPGGIVPSMPPMENAVLPALTFQPTFTPQIDIVAPTISQQIVSARTPQELAQTVMSTTPPNTTATVPIVRDDAKVFPESIPPPPVTTPTGPADFPPYTIRPEVIGAPVPRPVIPGMYDRRSLTSLFPSLVAATSVPQNMVVPDAAEPPPPPSPVRDIFNTKASEKIDQAIEMDYAANLHRDVADELQRKADEAAYIASQASAKATMDPTFDAQAAAIATAARADDAQYEANRATEKAALVDREADKKAAAAAQATQQIIQAQAHQQAIYSASVDTADSHAVEDAMSTPGMVFPEMMEDVTVPSFSVSPLVAAVIAGVIGYLLGGTRGGAVGAVLGGGGAYFMGQRQAPQLVQQQPGRAITGGLLDVPQNYVGESFVPYQESDGTWINSEADAQAYYDSHYLR